MIDISRDGESGEEHTWLVHLRTGRRRRIAAAENGGVRGFRRGWFSLTIDWMWGNVGVPENAQTSGK